MAFEIKKNVLKRYIPEPSQQEIVLPVGVEIIGAKAFEECGELYSLIIPEGVTTLKQYAFAAYVRQIKNLTVPSTLTETGTNSFPAHLNAVSLPKGKAVFLREHDSYETTEIITYLLGIAEKDFSSLRVGSRIELALIALGTPTLFSETLLPEVLQYAKAQKKKLLDLIMDNNAATAMRGALAEGLISEKTADDYLARAVDKPEIAAMLLEYKNTHFDWKAEKGKETVDFKPLSAADAKKVWSFDKNADGTGYILTSYKGTNSAIETPAVIAKLPVVEIQGICNCGYNSKFPYARQEWLQENIVSVQIADGVLEIGDFSFAELPRLKMVVIPASVTKIGRWSFDECPNLTMYGLAGSYAETYAKEHNIPFVAE